MIYIFLIQTSKYFIMTTTYNLTKFLIGIMIFLFCTSLHSQSEIEFDGGSVTPQLTLTERQTGSADDFSRLVFNNTTDLANRWTLASMSQDGAVFGTLDSPLAFAYTGNTRLLIGKDGKLRINNVYTLPNVDGTAGQFLTTDGAGNVSWGAGGSGSSLWTQVGSFIRYTSIDSRVQANATTGTSGFSFLFNGAQRSLIWNEFSSGDLNFTNSNSSSARHMVIDGVTHNVGIGTNVTNPSAKLEVQVTGSDGIHIDGDDTGDALLSIENGGGTHFLYDDDSNNHTLKIQSSDDLAFNTGGINERMRIDGTTGFVGLGELSPSDELHITGTTSADIRLEASNLKFLRFYEGATQTGTIGHNGTDMLLTNSDTNGDIRITTESLTQFFAGGFQNMAIESDGDVVIGRNALFVDERGVESDRVGINNLSPLSALHVNHFNNGVTGGFRLQNNSSNGWWKFYVSSSNNTMQLRNNTSGSVVGTFATNGVYTSSDKRLKRNLETMPYGLSEVMKIKALRYNYISDEANASKSLGFVAQELNEVIPELVLYAEDADQYSVNYAGLSVIAIKAIQEQQTQIEALQSENQELKNQIATILARLNEIEK